MYLERRPLADVSKHFASRRLICLALAILSTSTILFLNSRETREVSFFQASIREPQEQQQISLGQSPPAEEQWAFETQRDALNFGMSDEQCDIAFPDLYWELERARDDIIETKGSIFEKDVHVDRKEEYSGRQHGEFQVMIYDGELYVIKEVPGEPDRSRGLAALANMYRALTSIPNPKSIPNIEFVFDIEDVAQSPQHQPNRIRWSWAREKNNPWLWVMPDFDGWSYPDDGVASYTQFRADVADLESSYALGWDDKPSKLSWRGSLAVNTQLRGDLVTAAKGRKWSDVEAIDWHNRDNIMAMQDFCRYQYVAHTEGNSWSGRLRYLHNCNSVPVIHNLEYMAHYYHLLKSNGTEQNYVEVRRDWRDLDEKMESLIVRPDDARKIAAESTRVFRDRYLTPAAEACYWRRMFKTWRSVMAFEPRSHRVTKNGTIVRRGVSWERFAFRQEKSFEHGFYEEEKHQEYDEP
ncbi:O-glucosyltransferase rumi-like protein [Seiridium cupressi]